MSYLSTHKCSHGVTLDLDCELCSRRPLTAQEELEVAEFERDNAREKLLMADENLRRAQIKALNQKESDGSLSDAD